MSLPPNGLIASGFILATIASGFGLYYWRRASGLYALLVEGANRFEELGQRNHQLESLVAQGDESIRRAADASAHLDLALAESRAKVADLTKRLEMKDNEARFISEKLELQKDFLEKQLAKASGQISINEQVKIETEARQTAIVADLRQRASTRERELSDKLRQATAKVKELETSMEGASEARSKLEKRVAEANPEELRRLKRKISQYDRLYSSMRGLREMAEERNSNWEVALRKLSTWIIKQRSGPRIHTPQAIGPLVGQALQAIGSQLIDDAEIMAAGLKQGDEALEGFDDQLADETQGTDLAGHLTKQKHSHGAPDVAHSITLNQVDEVAKILRG